MNDYRTICSIAFIDMFYKSTPVQPEELINLGYVIALCGAHNVKVPHRKIIPAPTVGQKKIVNVPQPTILTIFITFTLLTHAHSLTQ